MGRLITVVLPLLLLAAALNADAAQGWYLLAPNWNLEGRWFDIDAPPSKWLQVGEFDSERECQAARDRRAIEANERDRDLQERIQHDPEARRVWEKTLGPAVTRPIYFLGAAQSRCISASDPGLAR